MRSPADLRRVASRWLVPALLGVAILAAYANTFDIPFVFDDWHTIEQNPAIRSLSNLPRFFYDPNSTTVLRENKDLRPLLVASLALNHRISGLVPWSYHAVNLLLHWIATMLVYRIVRDHLWLDADGVPVAIAAALIVAVHPLNTESVDYVSARSAVLTTVFYLAAFDAAARDRRVVAVLLAACAMLTKSIALTLPLAVLLHRVLAPSYRRRPIPWAFIGCLALVAAAGILYRWWLLPPWAVESARQPGITPWTYFITEWSALVYYLRLFVWPDALVVDRVDYPYASSLSDVQAWGSLLVLAALGVIVWLFARRRRAFAFAALWFVVTLAPESSFFPLAEPVNEHRPYLAMLGMATLAALWLWLATRSVARRLAAPTPWLFAVVVTFVATLLGATTHARNEVWRDDLRLWLDATEKAPRNARAWMNAGHAALTRGDTAQARKLLLEAHRLSPCYAYVQLNLSAVAAREGNPAVSLTWADDAVRCNPGLALARVSRAEALERLGRLDEALAEYREATRLDAVHAGAWLAQGRLLEQRGDWAAAAAAYDASAAADPTDPEALMRAGLVYAYRLRDSAMAVARFQRVLALYPAHYGAHYQLAVALLAAGKRDEALAAWSRFTPMAEAIGDRASLDAAPAELRTAR